MKYDSKTNRYVFSGLWPEIDFGKRISDFKYTDLDEFLMQQLKTIYPAFAANWLDLNQNFYEHEWFKHGIYTPLLPHQYFKKICELYARHASNVEVRKDHEVHFYLDKNFKTLSKDVFEISGIGQTASKLYNCKKLQELLKRWINTYKITSRDFLDNTSKFKEAFKKLKSSLSLQSMPFYFNNFSLNCILKAYYNLK